jgi:hypothetical protein
MSEATAASTAPHLTTEQVWRELAKGSFAVVSQVTPAGEPRSSGVLYQTMGRQLFVATAPDSWKAKHLASNGHVSMTVLVRRGGLLSLVAPIPPATITFHGTAIVHPAGSFEVPKELASLLPPDRRSSNCIIEVTPEGEFLTYGVGVSLMKMRTPATARGRVPVT